MKILRLLTVLLLLVGAGFAQAAWYGGTAQSQTYVSGISVSMPMSNASVLICAYGGTCDLAHAATVYTDSTGITAGPNPVTADGQGNFGFWGLAGNYQFLITYRGNTFGPYTASITASNSLVVHLAGSETITGVKAFTGGISTTQPIVSTLSIGTPPFTITSTTKVTNLNADKLDDADWTAPPVIGGVTPNTATFTTLNSTGGALNGTLGQSTPLAASVTTFSASGLSTLTGGVKAGASGSTISDTRELVQSAHSCGSTATCANTANGSYRMIFGTVALTSASPSTATVTGISPAFTSSSTYVCTATPTGATAAIAAGGIAITYVSGSSFTLTGPNTVTTVINYSCVGN